MLTLVLLLLGTLMPRQLETVSAPLHSSIDLSALAHVVLFAAISFMLPLARFWKVKSWHLPASGLGLALLSEGLQFLRSSAVPTWPGVYQDMIGVLIGWGSHAAPGPRVAAAIRARIAPSREM